MDTFDKIMSIIQDRVFPLLAQIGQDYIQSNFSVRLLKALATTSMSNGTLNSLGEKSMRANEAHDKYGDVIAAFSVSAFELGYLFGNQETAEDYQLIKSDIDNIKVDSGLSSLTQMLKELMNDPSHISLIDALKDLKVSEELGEDCSKCSALDCPIRTAPYTG